WNASHVVKKYHHLHNPLAPFNVVAHIALPRRPLGLLSQWREEVGIWGRRRGPSRGRWRNCIRNPTTARLCRWLGARGGISGRISLSSVIPRSVGIRTGESL